MLQQLPKLSTWLIAGLLWAGCSPSSPETQNIIIAPPPGAGAPLGTDTPELVPTTMFVSRGAIHITVVADDVTHSLRGPLLQGAFRTTDTTGFGDAVGEFDVISEGWRCDDCEGLIPVAQETLFPSGRDPYAHVTVGADGTGMLTVEWTKDDATIQGRFASTVTGTPRDLTLELSQVADADLFTVADQRALVRSLGVRRLQEVSMSVELHLTNDPVRAGASASIRITSPVNDGDSRPIWEEFPTTSRSAGRGDIRMRGVNSETRAILEGGESTPEFVNETGR